MTMMMNKNDGGGGSPTGGLSSSDSRLRDEDTKNAKELVESLVNCLRQALVQDIFEAAHAVLELCDPFVHSQQDSLTLNNAFVDASILTLQQLCSDEQLRPLAKRERRKTMFVLSVLLRWIRRNGSRSYRCERVIATLVWLGDDRHHSYLCSLLARVALSRRCQRRTSARRRPM